MQPFTFLLKQPPRIARRLERVPQVRQPHELQRMLKVFVAVDMECDPA